MRSIIVHDCYGISHNEIVYNCNDFPISEAIRGCRFVKKKFDTYVNLPCAFDIETTSVKCDTPYGFMYQWQFCMGTFVCFGRTWEEFQTLVKRLSDSLSFNPSAKYVVYCHQLAFEFFFMQNFITVTSVFAREKQKPLVVRTCEHIEFRCSYVLSNMSLSNFCKNSEGCIYWKKDGDLYDYEKFRLPTTPLTPQEEEYCYCDVRGLCECIASMLKEDTLGTIPMTSTGFVRRDFREVLKKNKRNRVIFEKLRLTPKQYDLCKLAFRGGNTSSNTLYVDEVLENVDSFDIQSSYPASMLMDKFPMTKFMEVEIQSKEEFDFFTSTKACLFKIVIDDIKVNNLHTIPYISRNKCISIIDGKYGNGRVLSASRIEMAITDVDWNIIKSHYKLGKKKILEMYVADYDYLPLDFRLQLLEYFKSKCLLKHKLLKLEEDGLENSDDYKETKYLYNKFKNKINACYGMMVTDIASPEISYCDGNWDSNAVNVEDALNTYYSSYNSFLSYQHGVWVTANARKRLQIGLDMVGRDCIYTDTDSVKCLGDWIDAFQILNDKHYDYMKSMDIDVIVTIEGVNYYIGDWEYEGRYKRFKTLGSKKYLVEKENGAVELTLAGVNKEKGGKWFADHGGCDGFNVEVVLNSKVSGRTTAYYNTEKKHKLKLRGCEFTTASNIAIIPTTYELGVTDEYRDLIKEVKATE